MQENVCFGSPSYASTFVCGKNSNGLVEWKSKDGVPLKDLNSSEKSVDISPVKEKSRLPNIPKVSGGNEILHLAGKKVSAFGRLCDTGVFTVCKGSGFSPTETKSCQMWIKNLRAELIATGKVEDNIFTEDVCFKSTSAAAACVIGGSASGKIMWIYPDGQTIKEKIGV